MSRKVLSSLTIVFVVVVLAGRADAQAPPVSSPTAPGSAVSFVGGLSSGSSTNGAVLGGTFNFDFNSRLALETSGTWLDRGAGADALHLNVGLVVNLLPAGSRAVPYVAAGGGLYRASFDLDHQRLFGDLSSRFGPGTQMVPLEGQHGGFGLMQGFTGRSWRGPWSGPTFSPAQMPGFYSDRLGMMDVRADGRWGRRSFTDPAVTVGGGLNANITEHLFVRPDARALIVFNDGDSYTVGLLSFSFGYRF